MNFFPVLFEKFFQTSNIFNIRGESAAEAGARLNMTEGAVRVALHRALRAIDAKRKRLLE